MFKVILEFKIYLLNQTRNQTEITMLLFVRSWRKLGKMNLMFRKNFREQKVSGITGKGPKSTGGRHASKRSSREQGYTPIEEHHYRTHLFFSPPRCSYTQEEADGEFKTEKVQMLNVVSKYTDKKCLLCILHN